MTAASRATARARLDSRNVLVVRDDTLSDRRVARALAEAGFAVMSSRAREAAESIAALGPGDIVVLLSNADAARRVEYVRTLAVRHGELRIVSAMPDDAGNAALRKALRAGADGVLTDGTIEDALLATVTAVAAGQLAVPRSLRRHVVPRPLSHREKQILALVVLGLTNRQIADKLYLAESTVKTHLSSSFDKLDVRSRSEATALIVDPEEGYGLGILAIASNAPRSRGAP